MRCNKCGAEWTPPPGKNITSCPFCSEAIQEPLLEAESDNIIKELVQEYGQKILLDSRLVSLVADKLRNENPQLLKRIRLAVNENIPKKLYDLRSTNEQERSLKVRVIATSLKDDFGTNIKIAYELVNYFAEALGYKPIILPKAAASASKQSPNNVTSQSQPTSKTSIGSIIPFGNYNWRVLDVQGDKALILTENIIEKREYNKERKDITWEICTLREYLNGEFLQKFTKEEQQRIEEVRVKNNDNLWYGKKGGENTIDKVFLLSLEEADKYFGNSGDYQNKRRKKNEDGKFFTASDGYCFSNDHDSERIAKYDNEACSWWLRSPGNGGHIAARVYPEGIVTVYGIIVGCIGIGVRPALWLKL